MINRTRPLSSMVVLLLFAVSVFAQPALKDQIITKEILRFEKLELDITMQLDFGNPFDSRDIQLDMMIKAPSGEKLVLPCYFESKLDGTSLWKARFAPLLYSLSNPG